MATTYYKKHKISKGETIAQSLKERFDYGQNPDKTEGGELISSYGCDHMTADTEFLLSKAKYKAATGREQRRDADVLCYQIRQSFKPGESKVDKLWLVRNKLHNFVDYMFFMIRNGQNQKFAHLVYIPSFAATKTHRKVTSQKLF